MPGMAVLKRSHDASHTNLGRTQNDSRATSTCKALLLRNPNPPAIALTPRRECACAAVHNFSKIGLHIITSPVGVAPILQSLGVRADRFIAVGQGGKISASSAPAATVSCAHEHSFVGPSNPESLCDACVAWRRLAGDQRVGASAPRRFRSLGGGACEHLDKRAVAPH